MKKYLITLLLLMSCGLFAQTEPAVWVIDYKEYVDGEWVFVKSQFFDTKEELAAFADIIAADSNKDFKKDVDAITGVRAGFWKRYILVEVPEITTYGPWEFAPASAVYMYWLIYTVGGVQYEGEYTEAETLALKNDPLVTMVLDDAFYSIPMTMSREVFVTPASSYYILEQP